MNDKTVVAETNPELTHKITLSFTPIYIDLNNRKRVGLSETIYCLNPLLNNENQKLPSLWNKYSVDDDKVRLQKGRAFTEICKKFAKFKITNMYGIAITYAVASLLLLGGFAYLTFKMISKK